MMGVQFRHVATERRQCGRWVVLLVALVFAGCAPRLKPLGGAPAPARLPRSELAPGHRRIVFEWDLADRDVTGRGEGVARIAAPDSARLDFFLAGGFGSGGAVLIGDSLRLPGGEMGRRFVPPPPLLWAALGRLALPAVPDTVARVDGNVLRVDIGRPTAWRITFRDDTLRRVERISGARIVEWLERVGDVVRYRNEEARRALLLTIKRVEEVPAFDGSIWGP
jgi:hypothetical protein